MLKLFSYKYIYLIPLLLSAIFSLKSVRLKWPAPFRVFSVFLLSTLVIEIFAISWKWGLNSTHYWTYSRNNLWIYNAFLMARHLFLLYFFYHLIHGKIIKIAIKWSVIPFLIFAIWDYIKLEGPDYANLYTIVIANLITVLLSVRFFYEVLKDNKIINLSTSTEVWISLGTFIYYSGTLPLFIFFNYLITQQNAMALSYLFINDALNTVMYFFYLISFLCKPHSLK